MLQLFTSTAIGLTIAFFWSVTAALGLSALLLYTDLDGTRLARANDYLLIFAAVAGAGMLLFGVIAGSWDLMLRITGGGS